MTGKKNVSEIWKIEFDNCSENLKVFSHYKPLVNNAIGKGNIG